MSNGPATVKLTIDDRPVEVPAYRTVYDPANKQPIKLPSTIYDAAFETGVKVPILCHREYMTPVAVCRVCVVDVVLKDGRREPRLSPACLRQVEDGMQIATHETSQRVRSSVATLAELLMADHPAPCEKHRRYGDCELELLAERFGMRSPRFAKPPADRGRDDSSVVIAVDHNACILCDRCIRGCDEIRHNDVLGRMGKGYSARIAFDLNNPMGGSSCVACGECMVSCPTGALVNRLVVRPEPWEKETPPPPAVAADELVSHPLFEGVAHPFLRWNEGAVVRRHYKKGDIVCREGEFGSSAFYVEQGSVNIFIQSPFKHAKSRRGGMFGLLRRFSTSLVGRDQDDREEESTGRFIHIDAPVSLDYDNPVAQLGAGEIFGEMSCMSLYPRSATVQAAEDCTLLEMLRNVLYIWQRGKRSKAMLDERYRQRALESHLRSVPLFASLLGEEATFAQLIEFLRERVQLKRLEPGQVIFRQGDPADHFYLVRIGFVKVSQKSPGGEHVLSYVGPGGYLGEIGLLSAIPEIRALAPPGVRMATCTAMDHVDLVQISGQDFHEMLGRFPRLHTPMVKTAIAHLEENDRERRQIESLHLGDFLRQGLFNAQSLLVLDLEKCTRCDECTKACADAHDGVTRLIREGLRFDKFLVASSCRCCLDPYCMVGCPVGSIRRRGTREIIIEDWCIGCGKCAENCPYGNINMHAFQVERPDPTDPGRKIAVVQEKATVCDLCQDLKDGQPSCVYACPHDAAHRMAGPELLKLVKT